MNKRLYVGRLSYSVNNDDLKRLFEPYGVVESVKVIRDRTDQQDTRGGEDSGRSRGFAFVEMSTEVEALEAVKKLDGTVHNDISHNGKSIQVSEAKPCNQNSSNSGGRRSPGGGGGGHRRHGRMGGVSGNGGMSNGGGAYHRREREDQY